jgi:cytochrome o ubiquinol oxidase subunit I
MGSFIFGRLTWGDLPNLWYTIGGTVAILAIVAVAAIILTRLKRWKWIWNEWLTATDPKKIGIMYMVVASLMLFRGGIDAIMVWLQQSVAVGSSPGFLDGQHLQEITTAHGDIMVFFVTMGFLTGLFNLIVPLQIGARDLAFPFLNTLSFWLYVAGAILINTFFVLGGHFAATGWLAETPLSEAQFSSGVGVDYWIWSLQISGVGTMISGINFLVTIIKMRAPGMTLMRMPIFTWAALVSNVLIVTIFPILAITIAMLTADRYLGMHFFTAGSGGNTMMYFNLIWMWGHPEVYILILPSYGIFSEIVQTFSHKKLAGYVPQVIGLLLVMIISLGVWLHHFYTMGAGADVNAAFGVATELITIPTAILFVNWISTMYKGKVTLASPMYWFLGFVSTFTFGGLAGMTLAFPAADYQLHNSLFLIAHFHTMIVGGALFGIFAGMTYWFPKFTGFQLDENLGKRAFWLWLVGFYLAFVPLYILGFMGATRRMDFYTDPTWRPLFITAAIGFLVIASGVVTQVQQVIVSIRDREKYRVTGDPWDGRTLEWATSSPPPPYNFAIVPTVQSREPLWDMKQERKQGVYGEQKAKYHDLELPKYTAMGIYLAAFALLFGFAMVWYMYFFAFIGLVGIIACVVIRAFNEHSEYTLHANEVYALERQ